MLSLSILLPSSVNVSASVSGRSLALKTGSNMRLRKPLRVLCAPLTSIEWIVHGREELVSIYGSNQSGKCAYKPGVTAWSAETRRSASARRKLARNVPDLPVDAGFWLGCRGSCSGAFSVVPRFLWLLGPFSVARQCAVSKLATGSVHMVGIISSLMLAYLLICTAQRSH